MNALIVFAALAAVAYAAPSGVGTIVAGPAGVVTGHGAIGPIGHGLGLGAGLGWGGHGAVLAAPVASAVVAGPALGLGHGIGLGAVGLGAVGLGHGAGVITNGGGAIGVSGHGATVHGPPTAPVVIAGPSGKVAADGLWGPTANIGHGAIGHGHGWW